MPLIQLQCSYFSLLYVLASAHSLPNTKNMCVQPDPELASLDASCRQDSDCVTKYCRDQICACPGNHYFDNCQLSCQEENDEADQIVAMKAGTTAIGTFLLIVVLVVIMIKERSRDATPKTSKNKTKQASKKSVTNGKTSNSAAMKPKPNTTAFTPKSHTAAFTPKSHTAAMTKNFHAVNMTPKPPYKVTQSTGQTYPIKSPTLAVVPPYESKVKTNNPIYTIAYSNANIHVYNTAYENVAFAASSDNNYETSTRL
ncbi:hypothetical protein Bpfe_011472 [Biomphalaria pfeifferi]|uniref:Kazal-like domain-containing protein n=1 Tax=Biomphalaria pfeifferi TaxID=112525 RepID=A0AAD8BRA2_BIOPF|nr:hypothetical protein Bpfe_011472 [Biomphalaria pfeifferi]